MDIKFLVQERISYWFENHSNAKEICYQYYGHSDYKNLSDYSKIEIFLAETNKLTDLQNSQIARNFYQAYLTRLEKTISSLGIFLFNGILTKAEVEKINKRSSTLKQQIENLMRVETTRIKRFTEK